MELNDLRKIHTATLCDMLHTLAVGDVCLLSGTVYTARDAAHKRMRDALDRGEPLPFDIRGKVIYYCGPTPTPPNSVIGACGPTTSARMNAYAPRLLSLGLGGMLGKGDMGAAVSDAVAQYGGVYLTTVGGAGAYLQRRVASCECIAYADLGAEGVYRLDIINFPVRVNIIGFPSQDGINEGSRIWQQ